MTDRLEVFDYGDIKDDHKAAAIEIVSLLKGYGLETVADAIGIKFKLVEIPKYDAGSSPFMVACKEAGIYCSIQGHLQEGVEPNIMQYPVVSVCDDIRNLEKLIPIIKGMELN